MEIDTAPGAQPTKRVRKSSWKLHQTIDELQKWTVYLQMSSERFLEELAGFNSRSTFTSPQEKKRFSDTMESLRALKNESTALKTLSRRLHKKQA